MSAPLLRELFDGLPLHLQRQAFTHASWSTKRGETYDRLAFLGDSVLGLAVSSHLYPRLQAESFGAGELTKIRARAVAGEACRAVAVRLGLGEQMLAEAPRELREGAREIVATKRTLSSLIEAVIGACYLEVGYERTAAAVIEAFAPEIDHALANSGDSKSTLQELLARHGDVVTYELLSAAGPDHRREFTVAAVIKEAVLGQGSGFSKKVAEQRAADAALAKLKGA